MNGHHVITSLLSNQLLKDRDVFVGAAYLSAGSGGISRVARLTAAALMDSGATVELLSLLDTEPFSVKGVKVQSAQRSKVEFIFQCWKAAFTQKNFIYDSVGLSKAHLRLPFVGRRYAVWMHGIEVWSVLDKMEATALEGAHLRIVNSAHTLQRYHEFNPAALDAKVCWLATEEDDAPTEGPDFSGPPKVLILGRIDSFEGYKGHAELIEVWPRVLSAVPGARLLIVGGGPGLADLRERIAASPAASNIELTGYVPEEKIQQCWNRAHVLAMPSRKEGFGLVYIEAMRQSLPVIGSVHDAAPEVNLHGETGFNVNLDKGDGLAEHLIELLRSPDLCRKMGMAGNQRWSEHFRFSKFKERIVPILSDFCCR